MRDVSESLQVSLYGAPFLPLEINRLFRGLFSVDDLIRFDCFRPTLAYFIGVLGTCIPLILAC